MKYFITILLCWFISSPCIAQGETNHWYFGAKAALNFSSGSPRVLFDSQMSTSEGSSSISDKNGNLLFYSDGFYVWNRNHERMKDPVTGWISWIGDNGLATQTGVIIPWPEHDSLYFVFSVGQLGGNLYYSVVNMNRNGGLGEVQTTKVLLLENVCEKLTAINHCNKKDFWAVNRKMNSDLYYSYQITSSGISSSPVISPTGNFIMQVPFNQQYQTMGYLKNSPDGRMLAAAHAGYDYVELTDFNTTSGAVTNPRKIYARPDGINYPISDDGAYGIEFSADSRLMYVTTYYLTEFNDTSALYQFDVSVPTEAAIQASSILLYSTSWYDAVLGLQMGPDKRIYVARLSPYLSIINNPEVRGPGCNFTPDALYLDDGTGTHGSNYGLPNFIQSYFNDPIIATGNCQFSNISFSLQNIVGFSSVEWNFDDPASGPNNISTSFTPTHIFTQEGQYRVRAVLQNANGCGADTIYKIVHAGIFKVFLGEDTTICKGDTLVLRMKVPNGSNLWNNNSSDSILKVTQSGKYWVTVRLGECSASDTINVTVRPLPVFSLGEDAIICSSESLMLSPNPSPPDVIYTWNNSATTSSINTNTDGQYWLKVEEIVFGCSYTDSINIQFKTLPEYSLGPDIAICEKDTITLSAFVSGATNYLWNTGATTSGIKVFQTGIYWADVTKDGCTYRDSVVITVKPLPVVNLGNDVTLCEDQVLQLDAQNPGAQYLWQNNSTGQVFSVNKAGIYFVTVTKDGCISKDTISIKYEFKPQFTLGKDTVICNGQTILLQPTIHGTNTLSYLWNNGSTDKTFAVTQPGLYSLELSNNCGSKVDAINIANGVCKLYVPSAFTPNNDGKNDVFKASFGENVTSYTMEVYNRAGQRVFISQRIDRGWDGKINGVVQAQDSYVWVIRYKVLNDSKDYLLKGIVTLIL